MNFQSNRSHGAWVTPHGFGRVDSILIGSCDGMSRGGGRLRPSRADEHMTPPWDRIG